MATPPAARPEGKRDLRTGDRNDSTRVFGLVDTAIGIALAIDPRVMGGPLQRRAITYVTGARPPSVKPWMNTAAFIAPALVPLTASTSRVGSSRSRSRTSQ
jgi:hypothetical protein